MASQKDLLRAANDELKKLDPAAKLTKIQVTAVFYGIDRLIRDGERVPIKGFGTFLRRLSGARQVRSPLTGEQKSVPARAKMVLKSALKDLPLLDGEAEKILRKKKAG